MHHIRTRPHLHFYYIFINDHSMNSMFQPISAIYLSIQLHCYDNGWCFCSNFLHTLRDDLIWNRCGHQHSGLCWKLITYQVLKIIFLSWCSGTCYKISLSLFLAISNYNISINIANKVGIKIALEKLIHSWKKHKRIN